MPTRLVLLAEEVLFQGDAKESRRPCFDALARLRHAGHPVAVILDDTRADSQAPQQLQQLTQDAGGQVVAFFHRPKHDEGLAEVLAEVTERWRVDPAQIHGVFKRPEDLGQVIAYGATAVALADLLDVRSEPPECHVYADLTAFVDMLLEDTDPGA